MNYRDISLFHVELWLTNTGVVLGELHVRFGGDWLHRMLVHGAGYLAHPGGNMARKRLHRLPHSCSNWDMRLSSVPRIGTWILGRGRRLWSQLTPRRSAKEIAGVPRETIDLIRDMAARGRLWGAERIRGELLKVGIKVSKRTIQKYMRGVRGKGGGGQSWATFVKNHAERMWVCDFIQTHDFLFRQVYAFFLVHLASRRAVHVAATRHPTQAWTAQQLRNATMDGDAPAVLLRERDDKFGPAFDRAAQGVGAKVIRTAVRAPNMNAVAERFVASGRRELLDHVLLVDDQHLASRLRRYQRRHYREGT